MLFIVCHVLAIIISTLTLCYFSTNKKMGILLDTTMVNHTVLPLCHVPSVYTTESRTARYKIGADKELKMAKEVKSQSILYVSRFLYQS
jgi:hypothetical protein